jgi:O-antigen/teichoic acid export membrane protein
MSRQRPIMAISFMLRKTWWLELLANNRAILVNATSLMGTLVVTSGLGFAYWWVVARQFEPAEAGLAAAAISAMLLLGTVGMMGMGTLLIGELARRPQIIVSLITTALIVAGSASLLLGVGFALSAAYFSADFAILTASKVNLLLFAAGVVITGMVLVLDQALLGLLRGSWQLWRNAVFALSKLLLLLPASYYFLSTGTMAIYVTWLIGNLLSLIFLAWLVGSKRMMKADYRPRWGVFRELRGMALAHHILNLSLQSVQFAMPVIVTVILSPEINASFYIAWLIASSLFIVPTSLTQALYAVSAADVSILAQKIRFTLRSSLLGVVMAGLAILVTAEFVLNFFDPFYGATATSSLRILVLAALPIIVRVHYVAICQIRRQLRLAAMVFLAAAILELSLAIAGALLGGLVGLSLGWVLAVYIEGAMMMFTVRRVATQDRTPMIEES